MSDAIADEGRYFLTRQLANIMEEMSALNDLPGSICLIQGETGIGKSRLLKQFRDSRLSAVDHLAIRFLEDGSCDILGNNRKIENSTISLALLQRMNAATTLLIDQFEYASEALKHEILGFWAREGKSRNLNLVLAGNQSVMAELQAYPFQKDQRIHRVTLAPFSQRECVDFLSLEACQVTGGSLQLTRPLRRMIRQSGGIVGKLERLARHQADEFRCVDAQPRGRTGVRSVLYIILVLALLSLVVLYLPRSGLEWFSEQANVAVDRPSAPSEADIPHKKPLNKDEIAIEEDMPDVAVPGVQADSPEITVDLETSQPVERELVNMPSEPIPAETSSASSDRSLLQLRMQATRDWLDLQPETTATIQVMTLTSAEIPTKALSRYLQQLEEQDVDIEKVFVYRRNSGDRILHGVLYGTYPSRQVALQQISTLPLLLTANQPIPRTVKGILQETGQLRKP